MLLFCMYLKYVFAIGNMNYELWMMSIFKSDKDRNDWIEIGFQVFFISNSMLCYLFKFYSFIFIQSFFVKISFWFFMIKNEQEFSYSTLLWEYQVKHCKTFTKLFSIRQNDKKDIKQINSKRFYCIKEH